MVKIFDKQNCLNLTHLAIYLMLTTDEMALYGDKLKDLNRYSTLTKGIFHFYIIEKGETPYDKLPKEMIRNMRHFNVMARLVDSIHDIFCYGLDEIELEGDKSSIVEQLKVFVEQVCKENIDHLDILENRPTITSWARRKYLQSNNIVKELFETALKGENAGKAEGKELLQGEMISKNSKDSLEIAQLAVGSKKPQMWLSEKERCEREEPENPPHITITVKNVVKPGIYTKDGQPKMGLGVELNIDGSIVPVVFKSTDQTFLYIITLMTNMESRLIRRSDFLYINDVSNENEGNKSLRQRKSFNKWIKKRYQAMLFKRSFDDWCQAIRNDIHRIDDAVSKIKRTLWDELHEKNKDAYYYCILYNHTKYKFYNIRIYKNNIHIDPKILERISMK